MNDDLQPVRALLAQTERQRDEALTEKVRLEMARRAADTQAEQLVAYRREYESRWQAEFCREGKIELVRCYQGFMQRLSEAIEQQSRIAVHTAVQVERANAIVNGFELRAAALKKLLERRLREGRRLGEREEQKETDDFANRAAWQRMVYQATVH
ncbi:MAG: flagellar FliJ family protein [Caldimonas sp.]